MPSHVCTCLQVGRVTTGDGSTDESLSLDSLPRQLGDQMSLCKSYAVIAKENNNLQLAWHLSAQIRAAQQLLSLVCAAVVLFRSSCGFDLGALMRLIILG